MRVLLLAPALALGLPLAKAAATGLPGGRPRSAPIAASRATAVTISGFGFGHGEGMGQWGAYGYASRFGWGYEQILAHFYGGTALGRLPLPEPEVTVELSELQGRDTRAEAVAGAALVASWAGGTEVSGAAFEVARTGGAQVVYRSASCAGPWQEVGRTAGQVTMSGTLGELQACLPGSRPRTYQGFLVAKEDGETDNVVGLEDYVDGVVPAESPASWAYEGGEAELEAQAIAARSYAVATMAAAHRICDTAACQVYKGLPQQYGVTADSAVAATVGQVLYCEQGSRCGPAGSVALTEYSASTGGYSAGGAFPAVPDLGDSVAANPVHDWSLQVPVAKISRAFPSLGRLTSVEVTRRNGLGEFGGRAMSVTLAGTKGSVAVTGAGLACALSLPSDWFEVGSLPGEPSAPASPAPASPTPASASTGSPTPVTASTTTTVQGGTTATTVPAASTTPSLQGRPAGPLEPGTGYWVATRQGAVRAAGAAHFLGNALETTIEGEVSAIAVAPGGHGYWLAGSNGVVLSFGDAAWYGSPHGLHLAGPIVDITPTPDGRGYWLVGRDGGVFAYGDAAYLGSPRRASAAGPFVAMAVTPGGEGYWLVTRSGAVFAYGDAHYYGSAASSGPVPPVVAVSSTPDGRGYWLFSSDGGVHAFGDAGFWGSLPTDRVNADVVAATAASDGTGYFLLSSDGYVYAFGRPQPGRARTAGYGPPNVSPVPGKYVTATAVRAGPPGPSAPSVAPGQLVAIGAALIR